jgi:hypothetical protein
MGRKCPRLQGFLLDYVAVHLGVSSRTALDLYGRYVRRQPEPPKGSVTDEEDSDSDSSEDFTEELLSDDLDVLELTSEDEGHSEEERAKKRREDNELVNSQAAAAAAAQLSTVKKRIDELEARLAQTKKENAELLEREKRYALKAAAAENQRLQPPSQEVMEKALEAEMLKRKEVYRKELLEEWDRVHQRESGRLHERELATLLVIPVSIVANPVAQITTIWGHRHALWYPEVLFPFTQLSLASWKPWVLMRPHLGSSTYSNGLPSFPMSYMTWMQRGRCWVSHAQTVLLKNAQSMEKTSKRWGNAGGSKNTSRRNLRCNS